MIITIGSRPCFITNSSENQSLEQHFWPPQDVDYTFGQVSFVESKASNESEIWDDSDADQRNEITC